MEWGGWSGVGIAGANATSLMVAPFTGHVPNLSSFFSVVCPLGPSLWPLAPHPTALLHSPFSCTTSWKLTFPAVFRDFSTST